MINEEFRKNWLKILEFNESKEIVEDPEKLQKYVRIGYRKFYFRIPYILNRLFKVRDLDELRRLIVAGTQVFTFFTLEDK